LLYICILNVAVRKLVTLLETQTAALEQAIRNWLRKKISLLVERRRGVKGLWLKLLK
jgi:hypothetical protein